MAINIFDISDWSSGDSYVTNSIVAWPAGSTTYWYSTVDNASNGGDAPSLSNPNWAGRIAIDNGEFPKFIWIPSYDIEKKIDAKVKQIQYGEGYRQVVSDGINNTLLEIPLSFDGRDTYEAAAIIHFLTARQGGETFIYIPPSPYAAVKKWKVFAWSDTQPFYDNFNIKTTFIEVLV